jgi:hypothetical protein
MGAISSDGFGLITAERTKRKARRFEPLLPRQLEDNLDKVFGDGDRAIFDWFALGHRFQSCCHGGIRTFPENDTRCPLIQVRPTDLRRR